jgi:hypothetical protein
LVDFLGLLYVMDVVELRERMESLFDRLLWQ